MKKQKKNRLKGIPYVLTNGMSLFPSFVFAQIIVQHEGQDQYVLPLILFYCFKTTILLLIRKRMISSRHLLNLSLLVGSVGCLSGFLFEKSYYLLLLSGILLGITSGTVYPCFTTVMHHEKKYNGFSLTMRDQIIGFVYAILFTIILFYSVVRESHYDFLIIGVNLLIAYFVVRQFPKYEVVNTVAYPKYSSVETAILFITGFFSIYMIKNGVKLGSTKELPIFFFFFVSILLIYGVAQIKKRYDYGIPTFFLSLILYKGMLLSFVLVFCTFYQVYQEGRMSLYIIYCLYLSAILLSPLIFRQTARLFPQRKKFEQIEWGIAVGLCFLLWVGTFYAGIFVLSVSITQLNRELNEDIYFYDFLPEDARLITKYRISNIGSVLMQIIMVGILYASTVVFRTISMREIFRPVNPEQIDWNVYQHLDRTKWGLFLFFSIFLFVLSRLHRKHSQDPHFYLKNR